MSISDDIRALAREGHTTVEIARRLSIRYQHAYNVLKDSNNSRVAKPLLTVDELLSKGFLFSSRWVLSPQGDLVLERPISKEVGVYAFAKDGLAQYVGVATMGLAKRLYFYGKPGARQRTSQRLNSILKSELMGANHVEVYTAFPPDSDWNSLPVHGAAGLELGLIKKYALPWNVR